MVMEIQRVDVSVEWMVRSVMSSVRTVTDVRYMRHYHCFYDNAINGVKLSLMRHDIVTNDMSQMTLLGRRL